MKNSPYLDRPFRFDSAQAAFAAAVARVDHKALAHVGLTGASAALSEGSPALALAFLDDAARHLRALAEEKRNGR